MLILGGINLFLISLNNSEDINIPRVYFEVLSVILSVVPVVWTNILDKLKEYTNELTPTPSVRSETPEGNAEHFDGVGILATPKTPESTRS